MEKLTVVLNGRQLDDAWGRVVEISNTERLEHHLEEVEGTCRLDYSISNGDVEIVK